MSIVILSVLGFFNAILWLVIGWRAMRAHERLASSLAHWVRQQNPPAELAPAFPFPRP